MIKEYSTYIFDLDGTLLSTLNDLTVSTNYTMRTFHFPEYSVDEVRNFVGNGIPKLIERAIPNGINNPHYTDAYQKFIEYYLEHKLDTTVPYVGIDPMLQVLKSHNKKIAIVSNKYCVATETLCKHFFSKYIHVAIGESANVRKKPAPDTVLEAVKRLNTTLDDAVYIGDSEVDIETAKNCGIPCVSVLWGFKDKDFLIKHGAETLISNPMQLVECIN